MITKNKVVSVAYELRTQADGEIVERAGGETPFVFICGYEQSIPQFEQNLLGKKEGESFVFDIPADQAYGLRNEDMLIELPLNVFEEVDKDMLKVGEILPMQDSLGRSLQGVIKNITEENLTMDFNHPLAGNHLYFKGEITEVRDASDDEIAKLNSGCGGSCSSCSSCGDHEEGACDDHEGGCGCN